MSANPTTLAGKIAQASIDVGSFTADKRNQDQNYSYISADQVLSRAGNALAKQGLVILPALSDVEIATVERQGKAPRIDARITFQMTVTDGEKDLVVPWYGYGSDYATPDKAMYKAITSGHKYFIMKLLNIGVGNEDGEHENQEAPAERKAPTKRPEPTKAPSQAPAQPVQMTYEVAKDVKVKIKGEDKAIGSMNPQQLNWVILNVADQKAVKAAEICLMHDDNMEPPAAE